MEDLDDLVLGLGGGNEGASLGLGQAGLELRLDTQRDVVGDPLDLPEAVQVRGRIRKSAPRHEMFPNQVLLRGSALHTLQ